MEYSDRVRLGDDGLYHWYYDLDMNQNRYMLYVTLKVLGVIGAFLLLLVIILPSGAFSKWTIAGIMLGCFAVVVVLTLGIYMFMYWRRGGYYRYRYDMGPDGVRLLPEEGDIEKNRILGAAAFVVGNAAGHPIEAAASSVSLQASEYAGFTAYDSVRKAVVQRKKDCILLKLMAGENVVFASPDDFGFVEDYILSRLKEGTPVERSI